MVTAAVSARPQEAGGFKTEYLNELSGTSEHLLQLAEAMPADKYGWRPGTGVRSTGEVYIHIALGNFLLLGMTGVKPPAEYYPDVKMKADGPDVEAINQRDVVLAKTVQGKEQVQRLLKMSLDAVREHFSTLSAADLDKPADFFGKKTTVRGIYLRILAHVNEHYGQSIAYARMNGIVPPWSK